MNWVYDLKSKLVNSSFHSGSDLDCGLMGYDMQSKGGGTRFL
jgi:hypothetical protein